MLELDFSFKNEREYVKKKMIQHTVAQTQFVLCTYFFFIKPFTKFVMVFSPNMLVSSQVNYKHVFYHSGEQEELT